MAPESENNLQLEIGHVLFIDPVGYSKLLIEEQKERMRKLTDIVLARVRARLGEKERAITALQHLLSAPYYDGNHPIIPALLPLDPSCDNLRDDPRFQKLCQETTQ